MSNSITEGEGTFAGCLGQVVMSEFYKPHYVHKDSYNFDGMMMGHHIEVKTKRRNVPPLPHYNCSVAASNVRQACDEYWFVSINKDEAHILGWLTRDEFFREATFNAKGEPDPESPKNEQWYFRADCYNVPVYKLRKP